MHKRGFIETLHGPVSFLQPTWFGYAGDLPCVGVQGLSPTPGFEGEG